jgi:hypothetical protein
MNANRCRHLRTKKMYTAAHPDEAFAEKVGENVTPCHFWCNLTQSAVGADDQPAHQETCTPGRSCFEE